VAYRGWEARARTAPRRALERVAPIAIAVLPPRELTRITGVVAPRDALLTSPIDRQPCVGYGIVIEERRMGWQRILKSAACGVFMVTDDSGTAVVEGPVVLAESLDEDAWMSLPTSVLRRDPDDGSWSTLPASIFKLMGFKQGEAGLPETRPEDGRTFRCQEVIIKPGDRVSVLDRAVMEIDPAGRSSFRDPPMLHHIAGSEDEPVIVAHDKMTSS